MVRKCRIIDTRINEYNSKREVVDDDTDEILCVEYFGDVKGMLSSDRHSAATMATMIKALDIGIEKTATGKGRYVTIGEIGATIPIWSFWDGPYVHRNCPLVVDPDTGEVLEQPTGRRKPRRGGKPEYVHIQSTKLKELYSKLTIAELGVLVRLIPYIEYGTGRLIMKKTGKGHKNFPMTMAEASRVCDRAVNSLNGDFKTFRENEIVTFHDNAYYVDTKWMRKGVLSNADKIQGTKE